MEEDIRDTERSSRAVCLAVWEAEDGRCELCGRPMDRRVATVTPRRAEPGDLDDWVLLCPFCHQGSRPPFKDLKVDKVVASLFSTGLGVPKPQAASWLRGALDRYGVITQIDRNGVEVWLPGIGRGWVRPRTDAPPLLRQWHCPGDTRWEVTVKDQSRTRGLPAPARRPETVWSGFDSPTQFTKGAVMPMKPTDVKTIQVAVTLPTDQWPQGLGRVTAPEIELTFRTPQGVSVTAIVKTKSARKAEKTMREVQDRGQIPVVVVQGQLMPEGHLVAATFQVQGRSRDTARGSSDAF